MWRNLDSNRRASKLKFFLFLSSVWSVRVCWWKIIESSCWRLPQQANHLQHFVKWKRIVQRQSWLNSSACQETFLHTWKIKFMSFTSFMERMQCRSETLSLEVSSIQMLKLGELRPPPRGKRSCTISSNETLTKMRPWEIVGGDNLAQVCVKNLISCFDCCNRSTNFGLIMKSLYNRR